MAQHVTKGPFKPSTFFGILLLHIASGLAVWRITVGVTWPVWALALGLFVVSMLGITVGYHRLFNHRAFKCGIGTRKLLAFMGALSVQGTLQQWVTNHRQHHAFTDGAGDPHTPNEFPGFRGFLWAHVGWLFFEVKPPPGYTRIPPKDPVIAWETRWNPLFMAISFLLPFAIAGWNGFLVAGVLRVLVQLHLTWGINSGGHPDGEQVRDRSSNSWFMALLNWTGEPFHRNHHDQSSCAYLGWKWYQLDTGKYMIILLEHLGLAWDVQRPNRG